MSKSKQEVSENVKDFSLKEGDEIVPVKSLDVCYYLIIKFELDKLYFFFLKMFYKRKLSIFLY